MFLAVFVFMFVELGPAPLFKQGWSLSAYLNHADADLVSPGATFNLNRHQSSLSFMFIFTAARSFALRARGLWTISDGVAVIGRLVSNFSSAV